MQIKPQLDASSEVPLYRQLHLHFKGLIQSGQLAAGDRLPPTRELAGLLGLNRTTVSAAYDLLMSEGLISGHVGRGSFVMAGTQAAPERRWDDTWQRPQAVPSGTFTGISFATSRPPESLFPLEDFRASCQEVSARADLASILQLGSPSGYEPLRHYLLAQARRDGTAGAGDDVLVVNGCQQALDLIARVLVRPGDKIAVEDPVYPGLRNLFSAAGAELIAMPVDAAGADPQAIERESPKLVAVTPDFQNPTGATLSAGRRAALLAAARRTGALVVENDIYGALRYEGEPLPTIKEGDESGGTVILRSFSKVSFPGLRVGWIIGPRRLIARLAEAKHLADLHTDQFTQAVLLRFAESGRLAAHVSRMLAAGRDRLAAAMEACARHLPPGSRFTRPQGGMNFWLRLPEPLDSADLLPRAQQAGVSYLPGRFFTVAKPDQGGLRLSFAGLAPEQIERGIALLGRVAVEALEKAPEATPAMAMV